MSNYYQIQLNETDELGGICVKLEETDERVIKELLSSVAETLLLTPAGSRQYTYVYRKMSLEEFNNMSGGLVANPRSREKWITESLQHSRAFQNKGALTVPETVAEIAVMKGAYKKIREGAIPQQGSRRLQPTEGRLINIFNKEILKDHPKGKINLGLKGSENLREFNDIVVKIKQTDPDSFMNKVAPLRWLRRNPVSAAFATIGAIMDGCMLTLAVIEDGGKWGPSTKIEVARTAGGIAGGSIATALGALALGTLGGSFLIMLASVIGSCIALGIASFFLKCSTAPGPGPPRLDMDPSDMVFGPPWLDMDPTDMAFGPPRLDIDPTDMAFGPPRLDMDPTDMAFGPPTM